MHFQKLSGDINWKTYGGKFVSRKLNNGDFDYWLVISVNNLWEATGDEEQDQYYVMIQAVSPESVSPENLNRAIESCGYDTDFSHLPLFQVEVLSEYGIYAVLWQKTGNNIRKLMIEAHKEAHLASWLFGFYMDRYENRIGQTGWDLIRGQDIREFFKDKYADEE